MLYGTDDDVQNFLLSLWERHPYSVIRTFGPENAHLGMFLGHIETTVPIEFSEIVTLCAMSSQSVQAGFTEMVALQPTMQ